MQLSPSTPASQRGIALIATLIFLGVVLVVFGSMFYWANSNAIITERNNQYNRSQNAAESAVEAVIGRIDRDFVSSTISNSSAYASMPQMIDQSAWPIQYMYSTTNGATGTVDVVFQPQSATVQSLNSQYSGLSGMSQSVDVYATATPVGQQYNVPASVHEALQFAYIPLFQFAIFYNVNLEIDPGAAMTITGPVFCNESIWEGSSLCTFNSSVTAVLTNYVQIADPFANNYNGSGTPTFLGGQPRNNANALVMPIGTNNSPTAITALLNLPPSDYAMGTAAAYSSNGIVYPANAADLVITNFAAGTNFGNTLPKGTNFIVYYQDFGLSRLAYDFYNITNTTNHAFFSTNYVSSTLVQPGTSNFIYYAGFSWLTNVIFYDWREGGGTAGKKVQAVQIDVGKLNTWLNNNTNNLATSGYNSDQAKVLHSGAHIGSAYVYNSVPLTSSQMPAVRVMDGEQMPNPGGSTRGFTFATPFPLYVWGDYNATNPSGSSLGTTNTSHTYPAALMADAITILSDNWNDSVTTALPTPTSTTINAAMLEGIVASNPNINANYSGGVENFMRLLENWNKTTTILTYNGSIVVLFYSQWATNSWLNTGSYYNPPKRNWAFDMNFQNAAKLPPLTPCSKAMIRGNWYAHE
jgi:Tfp pilus assembly protein PilX